MNFFDKVADVAEEQGHHPDLHLTDYREVKVGFVCPSKNLMLLLHSPKSFQQPTLAGILEFSSLKPPPSAALMLRRLYTAIQVVVTTHAIGGLSMFDAILAAKIDVLSVDYSPKWLRQQSHASA